jgi:hypothetical protein
MLSSKKPKLNPHANPNVRLEGEQLVHSEWNYVYMPPNLKDELVAKAMIIRKYIRLVLICPANLIVRVKHHPLASGMNLIGDLSIIGEATGWWTTANETLTVNDGLTLMCEHLNALDMWCTLKRLPSLPNDVWGIILGILFQPVTRHNLSSTVSR